MTYSVLQGDVRDVLTTLEGESFDAMLTDPPYGIGFMGKEWDTPGAFVERKPVRANSWDKVGGNHNPTSPLDRSRTRLSENEKYQGFMTTWAAEVLRVLKPGAFALVFGGTRTFHRLAVALEDAGFEMRDTLMWIYGSGFPKSKNLDGDWQGYGTSLKPAYEPVLLVRKPTPLTYAQNVLEHGTGALNIDGARVPFASEGDEAESKAKNQHERFGSGARDGQVYGEFSRPRDDYDAPGRWPANLIHDGSEEVTDLFPIAGSNSMTSGKPPARTDGFLGGIGGNAHVDTRQTGGTAARFYYAAKASTRERNAGLEDRNPHPTVKPLALTEYLARLLLPPPRDTPRRILVPFAGSGSEVIGALKAGWDEAVGIEREEEYVAIAEARLTHWSRDIQLGLFAEAV